MTGTPATARPIVTELVQTCTACPSQWDGKTADGRILYVRYRFSRLTVQLGVDTGHKYDGVRGAYLLSDGNGDGWDGSMETDEMQQRTDHILDWSQCVERVR